MIDPLETLDAYCKQHNCTRIEGLTRMREEQVNFVSSKEDRECLASAVSFIDMLYMACEQTGEDPKEVLNDLAVEAPFILEMIKKEFAELGIEI